MGAVGTRMGKNWIIENCTIINARCVGIILGQAPGVNYSDIDSYGDHIIRNNIIRRCGQAGIAGQKGATRSLISGNLIEETNYRKEFGGWETAALKFHNSVDLVIENNLIRGVYHAQQAAYGIWIDFGNQGTRISGNVVYNTEAEPLFLEMNHGPTLVDNNIFVGHQVLHNSEATIFAHNLFVDLGFFFRPDGNRQSGYFVPHTTKQAGSKNGATAQDDKWFNNIFIRKGLDDVEKASGYVSDFNVFLEGAKKSSFGDKNSEVDSYVTEFTIKDEPLGVTITLNTNDDPFDIKAPLVNAKLVGILTTTGQTIEDRYGNPITVNTDINGKKFTRPSPGPLSNLSEGLNKIEWSYRKSR
jgi:alpha-N-arabinofuranosidase